MRVSFAASIACASMLTIATSSGAFVQSTGNGGGTNGHRTVNVTGNSNGGRGVNTSLSTFTSSFNSGLAVESTRNRNNPARHRAFEALLGHPPTP